MRNATVIAKDVALDRAANRHVNPQNLARRFLEVVFWTESDQAPLGSIYLPLAGLRAGDPPGWITDLRITGPAPAHYEIWWLDEQALSAVRVLVDERQSGSVAEHCKLSLLDERGSWVESRALRRTSPFVPDPVESSPREPYAWVTFSLPGQHRSRSVRVSCAGLQGTAIREVEVLA